jgi:hypothetical protein
MRLATQLSLQPPNRLADVAPIDLPTLDAALLTAVRSMDPPCIREVFASGKVLGIGPLDANGEALELAASVRYETCVEALCEHPIRRASGLRVQKWASDRRIKAAIRDALDR